MSKQLRCVLHTYFFSLMLLANLYALSQENPYVMKFSKEALQSDFRILRNRYEENLANLYLYTPKPELDRTFDSLYKNIEPMTSLEFYHYITPLSGLIRDGHSNIYPGKEETEYYSDHALFFPFTIYWNENNMYIRTNLSDDSTLYLGEEILSINSISVAEIMHELLLRQVRDGNNENYAVWILNNYFREYFSYHFGHPEHFNIKLRKKDGSERAYDINALSKTKIQSNKLNRYPEKNPSISNTQNVNIEIKDESVYTTLIIKTWDDGKLKQKIDEAFEHLGKENIHNLIIDVRDNQGGNAEPAIQLLSNLLNNDFVYFSELKSVSGRTDTSQILKDQSWKMLGLHKIKTEPYKGRVYVLINGGSFSNTGAFCSKLQSEKRAVFIGEETSGNNVVFSGVFGIKSNTTLSNTKIICDNSNYRIQLDNISQNTGHGVMPDYPVIPTIEDLTDNKDVVFETALRLIYQDNGILK